MWDVYIILGISEVGCHGGICHVHHASLGISEVSRQGGIFQVHHAYLGISEVSRQGGICVHHAWYRWDMFKIFMVGIIQVK